MKKRIGFIGLGKMGKNMVMNLVDKNYKIVVYNRSPEDTIKISKYKQVVPSFSYKELAEKLPRPRVIWIMVSVNAVGKVIDSLLPFLSKNDIIIDGGNSFYQDSIKRHEKLKKKGIYFFDAGVSGGVEGARKGACLMIGGEKKIFKKIEKLFKDLSAKNSYGYVGKKGAGHFVKGIHNAIEYGMMGALNEGFEAIRKESLKMEIDLKSVAKVYNHGSIIEGKLTNWLEEIFEENFLEKVSCVVPKGKTEDEMKFFEKKYYMPVLKAAIFLREKSRRGKICGKIISALRNKFGGHEIIKANQKGKK